MTADGAPACGSCGATGCETRFRACLARDFSDPDYGQVHHLVVPAYGLQHAWYSAADEGVVGDSILDHLDRPPTDRDPRQHPRGLRRTGARPSAAASQPPVHWAHHIGDVDRSSADRYVATVRDWARSMATTVRR